MIKNVTFWLPNDEDLEKDLKELEEKVLAEARSKAVALPDGPILVVWQGGQVRAYSTTTDNCHWDCAPLYAMCLALYPDSYSILIRRE